MGRNVVVTGSGMVSPVGETIDESWNALKDGRSGAENISLYETEAYGLDVDIACEVDADLASDPRTEPSVMGRFTQLATIAADDAITDAGLDPGGEGWNPFDVGTHIATATGGIPALSDALDELHEQGRPSGHKVGSYLPTIGMGTVSIQQFARGPSRSPGTACAAGVQAVLDAMRDIQAGRADVMIAGGADAIISPVVIGAYESLGALSTRTDNPEEAMRPFDAHRDGFVLGEGAGILILESERHARERGADILARVAGGGLTNDAHHPLRPHPDAVGLVEAIERALTNAAVDPDDVDHVNAHGTSTPIGDEHEATALQTVFDKVPPVTSTKSMVGHPQGGAGAIEAAITVRAIQENTIHPTINHDVTDTAFEIPVVTDAMRTDLDVAISIAAGLGGTNCCLILTAA